MITAIRNEITWVSYYVKLMKKFLERNWAQTNVGFPVEKRQSWMSVLRFYSPSGLPGSGAGKGGGAGGSVRDSGGKLGEYGAAQEEHYFFNKQKEQLEKIKKKLKSDKPGEMAQKPEK